MSKVQCRSFTLLTKFWKPQKLRGSYFQIFCGGIWGITLSVKGMNILIFDFFFFSHS
jgi:hypothetical protein